MLHAGESASLRYDNVDDAILIGRLKFTRAGDIYISIRANLGSHACFTIIWWKIPNVE